MCLRFIKEFKDSIRNAEINYLLGETEQEFFKSIFYLRTVTRKFPTSYWALKSQLSISLKYYMMGNYKKAEKEFRLFTDRYPDSKDIPKAYYFRSLALIQSGEHKKAIKISNKLMSQFPKSNYTPKTAMSLGQLYYTKNNFALAITFLKSSLASITSKALKPVILEKLGVSYMKIGKKKIGMDYLKKLTSDFPESKEAKRIKRVYFS